MSMALINRLLQSYGYLAVFVFVALVIAGSLAGRTAVRRLGERAEAAFPDPPRIDPASERAAAH